jgi:hypothetical protein
MEQGNDPRAVVEALAQHEEAMSALYAVYAECYPEVGDLWKTMSQEEFAHGKQLRSLIERSVDLQRFVDARRYQLDEIRADTLRLRALAELSTTAGFPLQEAFRTAVRLENSLIESEALAVQEGDSDDVAAVLATLEHQTQRHQRHLTESFSKFPAEG